tara:strand:- start:614 stop:1042 length:429 start_codon:yes stop_codon:yes gene_type:complete
MLDLIQIRAVVESEYHLMNLSAKTRERKFCDARKMYSYIARKCTKYSLKKIGEFIERDHTTVLHSIKRCEDLMETDKNFLMKVRGLVFKTTGILNIKTATYKDKIDVFWSSLSNKQQEEIYIKVNEMYANNSGLKKEIHYVN